MFKKARLRLTLLLGTLLLLLYLITAGTVYVVMARLTASDETALLHSSAQPLAADVLKSLNRGEFPKEFIDLKALERLYPRISTIVLRDAMGQVLADTDPGLGKLLPHSYSMTSQVTYLPETKVWVRMLTIQFTNPYGQTEGSLQLALNIVHDLASLARLRTVMLEVGIGGVVLTLAAAFLVSHQALQPIARSWLRQQRFVADASHELRTPLAVMRANMDLVLGHANESVLDNMEWLANVQGELVRMGKLTDDLLTLARVDSNQVQVLMAPVNLQEIVQEVCDSFAILAEAKGIELKTDLGDCAQPFTMQGDATRLRQLVTILLDNALKYTPQGGAVRVELGGRKHSLRLQVADTGMGIEAADLHKVFDRFYRGDAARVRSAGGTGLGLSIAQWIAKMHRARITATSKVGEGSAFTVVFPIG